MVILYHLLRLFVAGGRDYVFICHLSRGLTGAGTCLAFVFGVEAGRCSQEAARVEQAAAVLVGSGEGVGRVRGYGVVGGGGLRAHGGQAAPQRAGALHLHPLRQRHLVFDRFLLVHSADGGGGGGRGARVWRHVLRRRRGERVQVMGAAVGRRR